MIWSVWNFWFDTWFFTVYSGLVGGSTVVDRPTLCRDCIYPFFFWGMWRFKVAGKCLHTCAWYCSDTYEWESHMNFETSFFHYGSHCSNFADMFSTWCIFVFRSNRPRHLTFCDIGAMRALYRVCRGSVQANSNVQDQPLDHDRHQDGWWWVWMFFCLIGVKSPVRC